MKSNDKKRSRSYNNNNNEDNKEQKNKRIFRSSSNNNNNNNNNSSKSYSDSNSDKDDSIGHYHGENGTIINERFIIEKQIGLGTFGKVFKCWDKKYNEDVAVKVVRNIKKYVDSAKIEADILDNIYRKQKAAKVRGCLKLYAHFEFDGFYCLITELLGQSLYDVLKANKHKGYPMRVIRDVSRQLLSVMDFLQSIHLIHTDLKVENILFTSECFLQPDGTYLPNSNRIKVIDFGGATYNDEYKSTIINTRQYRGPEVTLELGWSYPSDIWSVGCIICELYSGELFFQTHNSLEHLGLMERMIAYFPRWMIRQSPLRDTYFDRFDEVRWRELPKSNRDFIRKSQTIQQFFAISSTRPDRSGIADLVEGLLQLDPRLRFTPQRALEMPFVNSDRNSDSY